jgi:hypothetical protein
MIDDVERATGHFSCSRRSPTFKHYVGAQAKTYRYIFDAVNKALVGKSTIDNLVPIPYQELENAMLMIGYLEAGIK